MDIASETFEKLILTGDVNLWSSKWAETNYIRKNVARPVLESINQHGLIIADIGATYQADHILKDGTIPESSLDHVYTSSSIQKLLKVKKLVNSSTDHVPVVINLDLDIKKDKSKFKQKITKRSFKNFSNEAWNASLASKDWSPIYSSNTVDEKVNVFQKNIKDALNEVAPVKTFTIRSNY